jgi:hypothetical protein
VTALDRISRELAQIAEYEQGPEDGEKAFRGTLWLLDWLAEKRAVETGELPGARHLAERRWHQ